jgi:hypothetical protein
MNTSTSKSKSPRARKSEGQNKTLIKPSSPRVVNQDAMPAAGSARWTEARSHPPLTYSLIDPAGRPPMRIAGRV